MTNKRKPKILFLTQMPPPVHGSAIINELIFQSERINTEFRIEAIDIGLGKKLAGIGAFSIMKIWNYLLLNWRVLRKLIFRNYDAAYITLAPVGFPFIKDSILIFWLQIFRIQRIIHMHGKGIKNALMHSPGKRWYYNLVFRNSTGIHLSESLLSDLSLITSIKETHVLANGIPSIQKIEKQNLTPRIIYLSNFFESKGPMSLLKAAERLKDENLNFELSMVGGWPDLSFKDRLMKYYNSVEWNDKVKILGPLYGSQKDEILSKSDILVFPSWYELECFPVTVLEAMSCGLCIVASREGAISEILDHGNAGILIDPKNHTELAVTLKDLLENRNKIKELGDKAYQRFISNYTFTIFEERWIKIMTEVLK